MMGTLDTAARERELGRADRAEVDEKCKSLQRDLNRLGDPATDRATKRMAVKRVQRETVGMEPPLSKPLATALFEVLARPLTKLFADEVEMCREVAVQTVTSFVEAASDVSPVLPYLVPAIASRLADQEICEPSEEIRLQLVNILLKVVQFLGKGSDVYVDDVVGVVKCTLKDPYAEVQKESCKLVMEISTAAPARVALCEDALTKALVPTLVHKHAAVRVMGIKAAGAAVQANASGLNDLMDRFRRLPIDKAGPVRECLYQVIGDWLVRLPDRHMYAWKLVPVLLAGMTDDVPKIRKMCGTLLERAGTQYEEEHANELKDAVDFSEPEKTEGRPRLGTVHLVRECLFKGIPRLIEDMSDWNAEIRLCGVDVLCTMVGYGEGHITGHMNTVLPALYKAHNDDDKQVSAKAILAAETIGRYVDPKIYLQLALPSARAAATRGTKYMVAWLRIIRALLRGSPAERATPSLKMIIAAVRNADFLYHEDAEFVGELVRLAETATGKAVGCLEPVGQAEVEQGGDADDVGFGLFDVLVSCSSFEGAGNEFEALKQQSKKAMTLLAQAHGFASTGGLYQRYFLRYLHELCQDADTWNRFTPKLRVLHTVLVEAGSPVGEPEALHILMPVFTKLAQESKEFEVRRRILRLLSILLDDPAETLDSHKALGPHLSSFVRDVVISSGTWRVGRKAAILRLHAMQVLLRLLEAKGDGEAALATPEVFAGAGFAEALKPVVSCLEDADVETRRTSLMVVDRFFAGPLRRELTMEQFKEVYPELLKRLDDSRDELRVQTCGVFLSFFAAVGSRAVVLDDVHWDYVVKGVLIHLDDGNEALQNAVALVLESAGRHRPAIVREHLNAARFKHRSVKPIDDLLSRLPGAQEQQQQQRQRQDDFTGIAG